MIFQPKLQSVGTVSDFMSGAYKYNKVERKVNKKLIKWGVRVAVTVVAGSFMLDLTIPTALGHAMTSPEAIPVNAVMDKVTNAGAEALSITVAKALDPLIQILKELAKPIAGVMVTWGCLRYMIGQQDEGVRNIQQAAIGYILVMLSPLILNLITGVGGAIS